MSIAPHDCKNVGSTSRSNCW